MMAARKVICPKCNNPIPAEKIACPLCTEEASKKAVRDYQAHGLRKVFEGEAQLITRAVRGIRHVQVFGGYDRAFCGAVVTAKDRKERIDWNEDDLRKICAGCRKELEKQMEAACRVSA